MARGDSGGIFDPDLKGTVDDPGRTVSGINADLVPEVDRTRPTDLPTLPKRAKADDDVSFENWFLD